MNPHRVAAIYARRSLDLADSFSIASQRRAMLKLAADKGCRVPEELQFEDDGGLGGEADRPGFVRLRETIRGGLVQTVIAYDLDRLVRGLALQMIVQEECERHHVELIFCTAPDPARTAEARMMMQLKGVFAEYEKHKIRERTSRGRREKIEQKFVPSGRAAYGYRYKGKAEGSRGEWVIVPEQAAVVRRIFRMAERGMGALEIARKLEADGIPTATGARWNKAVVSAILRNTAYYGSALFNRHYLCEPRRRRKAPVAGQSKKTSTGLRDQSEWIEVPVPAIIDKALFDRVRAAVERSAAARVGRPTQAYLLSGLGLLKCGLCGRALYAYPNRGRSFYRCGHIDRLTNRRLCDGRSVWVRELETAIWDKTVETLSDADELRRQVAAHDHARIKAQKDGAKRRAALEREIFKLRQREQRTAKDLLDAELESVHAAIRAGIKATAAQRRAAERELQALTPQSLEGRFAGLDLEGLCRDFRKAAKDATPEQKRKILSAWVREIRVWGHGDAFEFEMKVERPVAMLPEKQRPASVDATNWKYQQSVAGSLGGAR